MGFALHDNSTYSAFALSELDLPVVDGVSRNISMYLYNTEDYVSSMSRRRKQIWEHSLIKDILFKLFTFAEVGACWEGQRGFLIPSFAVLPLPGKKTFVPLP